MPVSRVSADSSAQPLEHHESKAGYELLRIAYTVASDNFFVWLQCNGWQLDADLTFVVVHVEKLLAKLVLEGYALYGVALRLSAASLHSLRTLDHIGVDRNAHVRLVSCRVPWGA